MKVIQYGKPSSAVMKLALMRTTTRMEDPELPLLERISSLELPASETADQINVSQSSSIRHISTSTVQRRLCESGLRGQIATKKQRLKDTNKKKRVAWAKKHKQWTFDQSKFVLWSGVQSWDFWFQQLWLCETLCGWTDDLRMCISHHKAWRRRCYGVGVLCWWHCLWFI